jgi:hypothetical protein
VTLRALLVVALTTGRAYAGQVKDDDPYYKGYPGPPRWGFDVGLMTTRHKKVKPDGLLDKYKESVKVNEL